VGKPGSAAPRRFFRPTWAEVDLSALRRNLKAFKSRMPRGTGLMFVVKANAYGHGAVACAKEAERHKLAAWLGVSSVEEGVLLRDAGVKLPILVLGSLYPFESFLAAAAHDLTPTVASLESAMRLVEAAKTLGRRVSCHLKIETGMGRIGISPAAAIAVAEYIQGNPSVQLEGAYTHLACAEESRSYTNEQLSRFEKVVSVLKSRVPLVHAANSAGALKYPKARYNLVRPGLAIYGLYPGFEPVLTWKTKLVFIKTLPKGSGVSYGASFKTRRVSRVATLPVGYADGFSRANSGNGDVLIGGRRCPIVGRVTMDMTMVDVTDCPQAHVGGDAVLIGRQGKAEISAGGVAERLDTISYEVTTTISSRVPRVFLP
jgi:alanine racemase